MVDALEPDIADAMDLSLKISDWEMRWFIRTLADRDIDKLSSWVRERLTMAEKMTLMEYRDAMATRDEIRKSYEELYSDFDACITLAASGAAPMGLRLHRQPDIWCARFAVGHAGAVAAGAASGGIAAGATGDRLCQPRCRFICDEPVD
jgi:hypothetical protein